MKTYTVCDTCGCTIMGWEYRCLSCKNVQGSGRTPEYRPVSESILSTGTSGKPLKDPIDCLPAPERLPSLPEAAEARNGIPLYAGFMAYFPNAMAEVAKLSYAATRQHHPDKPMHWDRSKSTEHLDKIARHMIDAGLKDGKGQRHSAMVAWRAMANLQCELEAQEGFPPSPASRNVP